MDDRKKERGKTRMNDLEKLGRRIAAGSEQQAEQLVRRALAVLGFRVVHESWGMCIETVDGECDVFFAGMPGFSTSSFSSTWSSILGKLVAWREFEIDKRKDWRLDFLHPAKKRHGESEWISNPLFGCKSMEEVEIKLDLLGLEKPKK